MIELIKRIKAESKRRCVQSIELIIQLKDLGDFKLEEDFFLPNAFSSPRKVLVFAESLKGDEVLDRTQIEAMDEKKMKKLAKTYDFFLAEPGVMSLIAKRFAKLLGPKGKMPKLVKERILELKKVYERAVRLKLENMVIQAKVGDELMEERKVEENIKALLNFLETRLPKGKENIKEISLKLTMGTPRKLEW